MSDLPDISKGWICEIFSSIQGEGIFVGQRHTFIRLAGCNLSCRYCDTASSQFAKPELCKIEKVFACGGFDFVENPLSFQYVTDICTKLKTRIISITGGEPLIQTNFLCSLLPELRKFGFKIHLETNGILHYELSKIIDSVDVIAMDIKLESATGQETLWDYHRQFLEKAIKAETFVKCIVNNNTSKKEIRQCAELISSVNNSIPLVIQPVTGDDTVNSELLLMLQEEALKYIEDVRVIPQCHKIIGVL